MGEALRAHLECGILCFGYARARCKGRGVCPSWNGHRMAQTAAHLVGRVIPPVPVRQWVISVPKRLRCFLADRPEAVTSLTKVFIDEIKRLLRGAAGVARDSGSPRSTRPRLGAVFFLHRFGSGLNRRRFLQPVGRPQTREKAAPSVKIDPANGALEGFSGLRSAPAVRRVASALPLRLLIARRTVAEVPLTGLSFFPAIRPATGWLLWHVRRFGNAELQETSVTSLDPEEAAKEAAILKP